jgi:hypothetical protein
MSVHLLGELAGDLDGLHLRGEGSAEDPLDEVLDPLLEVSQNADSEDSLDSAGRAITGSRDDNAPRGT